MRITLREIFLLVALAAVACGWWVEHRTAVAMQKTNLQLEAQNESLFQSLKNLGNAVGEEGYEVAVDSNGKASVWRAN